ncbi:MAG: ferredoxin family protein [Phycisphaerae bacterium]|nr:ferredoxin family protein [Phycisphaerae bacterium]
MTSSSPPTIFYCHCANADIISQDVRQAVFTGLRASPAAFEPTSDLCGLAAERDPLLKRIASSRNIRIAACHERAVRWLFATAGAPLPDEGVKIVNMTSGSADEILTALLAGVPCGSCCGQSERPEPQAAAEGQWKPWFPVIDYDRCTGCKQCLNFCLFGVFEISSDDKVRVANPANCKLNCPACARICPETAVIFPKHPSPPINGGTVDDDQAHAEATRVNLQELLKGDVYEVLRQRDGRKVAQDIQQAMEERAKCSCASKPLETLRASMAASSPVCDCDCECHEVESQADTLQPCEPDCDCNQTDDDGRK